MKNTTTTKTMVKFPSIDQFRNTVRGVVERTQYSHTDSNSFVVYDKTVAMPTLTFTGTVKLHGTNAGVSFTNDGSGVYAQSRRNVITPEKDNANFAKFVKSNETVFETLISENYSQYTAENIVTIFGEWAGKGIQKGVGINEIDKAFFVFGVKVTPLNGDEAFWVEYDNIRQNENRIFNIRDFKTYEIDIDFTNADLAKNALVELTDAVEKECPVAKHFGIQNGVGEGIVWKCQYKGKQFLFKVKGEKHSVSNVKTMKSVDTELLGRIQQFVDYAVTKARVEQACSEVNGDANPTPSKQIFGLYIKWTIGDVFKEESDIYAEMGLTDANRKGVCATISKQVVRILNDL